MTTLPAMRLEHDTFGPREVPAEALYGAQTSRSIENFRLSGTSLPMEIIHGMTLLKLACARANARLGLLPARKEQAIADACRAILSGAHEREFPVDLCRPVRTSSHMNLNEVIAACQRIPGKRGIRRPCAPTTTSIWANHQQLLSSSQIAV